jgi:predicted transcriptional regulator
MSGPWKSRPHDQDRDALRSSLGHLEFSIMEILWTAGESSVHSVCSGLIRPLAYTTVMTTLERLYKKSLLLRRKEGRAFLYSPRLSRGEWEQSRLDYLVSLFADGSRPARELLFSTLVDTVGEHDRTLLDVLEKKIQSRRTELSKRDRR